MKNPRLWSFNIDRWLNPLVPSPPWSYVPYPVAHFFGYRKPGNKPKEMGNLVPVLWAFLGVFCGVATIEAASMHIPAFKSHGAPIIVGSFGAAAVLEFYAIESPLAQPRNVMFGQLISAIVGVCVQKLFLMHPNFSSVQWAGGALACAGATSAMALTKTVHPPAGATALLAVVDDNIVHLGWFLIPVMALGCALILAVALVINNLQRRFPQFWWTPEDLRRKKKQQIEEKKAEEGTSEEPEAKDDEEDASATGIIIRPGQVIIPDGIFLRQEEKIWLESISQRL